MLWGSHRYADKSKDQVEQKGLESSPQRTWVALKASHSVHEHSVIVGGQKDRASSPYA